MERETEKARRDLRSRYGGEGEERRLGGRLSAEAQSKKPSAKPMGGPGARASLRGAKCFRVG